MPTVNNSLIPTDDADLATWEARTDTDLVAADTVERALVEWASASDEIVSATNVVTVGGATTDATRYREITSNTGEGFADNANAATNDLRYNASNGAAIRSTDGYENTIIVSEQNFHLSRIQVKSAGLPSQAIFSDGQAGLIIEESIIEGRSNSGAITVRGSAIVRQNLVIQRLTSAVFLITAGAGITMVNNTFVVPSDLDPADFGYGNTNYGVNTIRNNAFFGVAAVRDASSGTHNFTTCMTDVVSPPSGCTTATFADQFVDPENASSDFRLKTTPSPADCIDAGTDDATHAATDIIGTTRPAGENDIGCWEVPAAAGTLHQHPASMRP